MLAIASAAHGAVVVCPPEATATVEFAAKELRRYVYLRTGTLLPIEQTGAGIALKIDSTLGVQQYRLETNGDTLTISGGSDVAVLYGAYTFVEKLGVRFEIHGDVIPDERLTELPMVKDETGAPLFELRGLQPFHDFPEGPDWWTTDDWLAVVSQATKMRMNFIGLHTYPFHNRDLGPEPTVWVGFPEDVNGDGTVKVSDYAAWYTTAKFMPYGCYSPAVTGSYSFGGAEVFPTDNYGSEVNQPDDFPFPKSPAANVALINRTGAMLKTVFDQAHRLGMKIAVGTESPLDIPDAVMPRLKELGLNSNEPATLQRLYAGIFTRIQRAYPIDYYWIWGHEGEIDQQRFITNLQSAYAALETTKEPFKLGICGWGWLAGNFPALDTQLPKDVFFSAINMSAGNAMVSENFGQLESRQKWAIPWFEDDGVLTSIQLRVGRVRRDAVDARRYGCHGLMGLHWRTRIISPNIAALAQAGWVQGEWSQPPANAPGPKHDVEVNGSQTQPATVSRDLPAADFYEDWATVQFGREVSGAAAAIFTRLDGHFPVTSGWNLGPGVISVNPQPWSSEQSRYAFVDEFAALRPHVRGAGNLERFDWWLNTFNVTRRMGELGCARGELDSIIQRIEQEADPQTKRQSAREQALPVRLRMVTLLAAMYESLLATLNNATELGTVANIEQQSLLRVKILTGQDAKLESVLGEPLPPAAHPWTDYRGSPRLVVLTARTAAAQGESLLLKIVALDKQPMRSVVVHVRPLGAGDWSTHPATHVARSVYEAKLPPAQYDFEYFVTADTAGTDELIWPVTSPQMNHTVVIEGR
jgi:hypothetical protein